MVEIRANSSVCNATFLLKKRRINLKKDSLSKAEKNKTGRHVVPLFSYLQDSNEVSCKSSISLQLTPASRVSYRRFITKTRLRPATGQHLKRVKFSRYQLVLSVITLLTTLQITEQSTMLIIKVNQVRRRLNLFGLYCN